MATVQKNISKKTGEVLNWKWTALLGRDSDGKQIKLTKRVDPLDEELTPAKEKKKMKALADAWEEQERKEYLKHKDKEDESKAQVRREKNKITLADFIDNNWMEKHVKNGVKKHTPDTIAFYAHMSDDIKEYFNTASPNLKLSQIEKRRCSGLSGIYAKCSNNQKREALQQDNKISPLFNPQEYTVLCRHH